MAKEETANVYLQDHFVFKAEELPNALEARVVVGSGGGGYVQVYICTTSYLVHSGPGYEILFILSPRSKQQGAANR